MSRDRGSQAFGTENMGAIGGLNEQMTTLTSGATDGFRISGAGVNFTTGVMSKSQSRGTALIATQTKFKQKRLKTSQGGRRQNNIE